MGEATAARKERVAKVVWHLATRSAAGAMANATPEQNTQLWAGLIVGAAVAQRSTMMEKVVPRPAG
eukprot:8684064-Lingulodinium_polyedra.AAC.1